MIFKLRFGKWRLTITLSPVIDVIGVNSLLPDGNHILMWDFDDVDFIEVMQNLEDVQNTFQLPNIYILNTGKPNSYIAYSFARVSWWTAKMIIASTHGVCENFYKWGVFRKRFTLRVSPKCGRIPRLACVIPSIEPEDADIKQLRSWVQYETLTDKGGGAFIKIG